MKSPAFQFYPDDFLGGKPGMMTAEEIGVYVLLLCLDWNQNGFSFSSNSDHERVARWCKVRKPRLLRMWETLRECFVERDGRMYNPRLEMERAKQAEYSAAMAANGRKGGRPAKSRGKADRKPIESTPSPSPSPVTDEKPKGGAVSPRAGQAAPWMGAIRPIYVARYDAEPPRHIVKALRRVVEAHGVEEVARRFEIYCAQTEGRFFDPHRFASTWGEWSAARADPVAAFTGPEVVDGWFAPEIERLTAPRSA